MNPTAQTSPERKNATTPSAGALRAEKIIRDVFTAAHAHHWEPMTPADLSEIIDRETGTTRLADALRLAQSYILNDHGRNPMEVRKEAVRAMAEALAIHDNPPAITPANPLH